MCLRLLWFHTLVHCFVDLFLACEEFSLKKFLFTCFVCPFFCEIMQIHHLIYFIVVIINFFLGFCNFFKSTKICKFLKNSSFYISLIKLSKTNLTSNMTMINRKKLQLWLQCFSIRCS